MVDTPMTFDAEMRWVIDTTIKEVCAYRRWDLDALNVRSTHVHIVVSARETPERVMNDFKAYCTRRLAEAGLIERGRRVCSHHGSTRYLDTGESYERAVEYTVRGQGPALAMVRPRAWNPARPNRDHERS